MIYALGEPRPHFDSAEWYVAPSATVVGRVRLGHQASVWFSAVVRGDVEEIVVGEGSNIQDGAVLHADAGFPCVLERDVTVGHLAMVHGCRIGAGSMVGIGATILNGARIGSGCIIGANALVSEGKVIPDNSLVLGVPGKVIRETSAAERERIAQGTEHYRKAGRLYRENLREL